jgi:hypothetical protein
VVGAIEVLCNEPAGIGCPQRDQLEHRRGVRRVAGQPGRGPAPDVPQGGVHDGVGQGGTLDGVELVCVADGGQPCPHALHACQEGARVVSPGLAQRGLGVSHQGPQIAHQIRDVALLLEHLRGQALSEIAQGGVDEGTDRGGSAHHGQHQQRVQDPPPARGGAPVHPRRLRAHLDGSPPAAWPASA